MPEIQLNGKTIATQTGTNEPVLKNNVVMESGFSIPSGVTFPAGHVVQTVYLEDDTKYIVTNTTSPGDIILTKSIIPKFSTSKILIMIQLSYSKNDVYTGYTKLYRNNTWVYPYTSDRGFSLRGQSAWSVDIGYIQYLDSPSTTNSTTYNLYSYTTSATEPMTINYNYNDTQDSWSGGRASSSMILMEIAQ